MRIWSFLSKGLQASGYTSSVAETGAEALALLTTGGYDLILLDIGLPDIDGLEVLRRLRAGNHQSPVIILTARDAVSDRVAGLEAGADDYIGKPFAFEELLARVRALLRRGRSGAEPLVRMGDLCLDPATRVVTRGGRRVSLTSREYALLEYFLRNTGRVLTRPMITQHVWGMDFDPESNIIDVYVGYLRRKIDGPGEPRLLQTVRGAGYMLSAEP